MRILIYSLNYPPELVGVGKYTGEMAEWLRLKGHQVRVITALPYYPAWQVAAEYTAWKYYREIQSGIRILRCPIWIPRKPSGMRRILHLASFALSSLPQLLNQVFWRPDVVWVVEPAFLCIFGALITSRLCGAKAWLHVQDFEIDSAFKLGILPSGKIQHWIENIECRWMWKFDRVSTISSRMLDRLSKKKVMLAKRVLFCNWVDTKAIYPLNESSLLRKQLRIPKDTVVALYSGNIGQKQGLDIIVETARILAADEKILFVLCGNGADFPRIKQLTEGLSNIKWLPLQPNSDLNNLLNLADIHLLPQRADVVDLVMPSKLTGMLASGRPVIATAHKGTQIAQVLEKAGVVVPPGNLDEFISALKCLAYNQEIRYSMGSEGRVYAVKNFDRKAILYKFEKDLFDLYDPPI